MGCRAWARHQLDRLRELPPAYEIRDGRRVNLTEEEIAKAETQLRDAEGLIRELGGD
jgi:hypothetical protein